MSTFNLKFALAAAGSCLVGIERKPISPGRSGVVLSSSSIRKKDVSGIEPNDDGETDSKIYLFFPEEGCLMFVENLMKKPLWIRLGSGRTLHVGPNSQSSEVNQSEVDHTPALQKLIKLKYVSCQSEAKESPKFEAIKKKPNTQKTRRK